MRWLFGVSCALSASRGQQNRCSGWVAEHRTAPAPPTPHRWRTKAPAHAPRPAPHDGAPAVPSPPQLAWLLVQPPSALSGPDAALVARVEQDPTAAHVASPPFISIGEAGQHPWGGLCNLA